MERTVYRVEPLKISFNSIVGILIAGAAIWFSLRQGLALGQRVVGVLVAIGAVGWIVNVWTTRLIIDSDSVDYRCGLSHYRWPMASVGKRLSWHRSVPSRYVENRDGFGLFAIDSLESDDALSLWYDALPDSSHGR